MSAEPTVNRRPTVDLVIYASAAVDPDDGEAVEDLWSRVYDVLDAIPGVVCTGGSLRPVE